MGTKTYRPRVIGNGAAPAERFWLRVPYRGDGCWEWQSTLKPTGYGIFKMSGRSMHASRAAYILTRGEIPEDLQVCHHCDNPRCVRPDHLFLGTPLENTQDRMSKGRPAGRAKIISPADRDEIKRRRATESIRALAKHYGVSHVAILKICREAGP